MKKLIKPTSKIKKYTKVILYGNENGNSGNCTSSSDCGNSGNCGTCCK